MAALRNIFVIRTLGSKRRKLRTDCFGFAIDITTLLSASVRLVPGVHLSCCKCPTLKHRHTDAVGCRCRIVISGCRFDLRAGRTTPRQTADRLALSYQQRATQSCIQVSRSTGAAAGAPKWTSEVANSTLANEASNNDQTAFGDNRAQVSGRPRAINMLRNGFLSVGAEPDNEAWQK